MYDKTGLYLYKYLNCLKKEVITCVDQSKQVTVLCLDHLSSKNSRLNDSLPDARVSLNDQRVNLC